MPFHPTTTAVMVGLILGCVTASPTRADDGDTPAAAQPDAQPAEAADTPPRRSSFFERLFGVRPEAPQPVRIEPDRKHLVIVCGLTGGEEFRERFTQTTLTLIDVLTARGGFDRQLVQLYLGDEDMATNPDLSPFFSGDATGQVLKELADRLTDTIEPTETLWLIVIGHSYFDGRRIWLNLPGDDIHEETFGQWFSPIGGRETTFWLTFPTSGFYIRPLSQPGRILISATEADREVIATQFPHMLADVLANPPPEEEQDQDGDGRLSLLDLYLLTTRRVAESFQERELIATEHARLDDNGDRRGTEVQRHYLPMELEGTLTQGAAAKPRVGDVDGAFAASILLPTDLLKTSDDSADIESAEDSTSDGGD